MVGQKQMSCIQGGRVLTPLSMHTKMLLFTHILCYVHLEGTFICRVYVYLCCLWHLLYCLLYHYCFCYGCFPVSQIFYSLFLYGIIDLIFENIPARNGGGSYS